MVLCLLLVAGWHERPQRANSNREAIGLGSVRLYLGQTKSEVLATLVQAGYLVTPFSIGDDKQFTVSWKKGDSYHLVGNIGFTAERLTFANKNWNPDDSSGYEFAKAIFFASKSLNQQGCESVLLTTASTDERGGQIRTATIYCTDSRRRFEISAYDINGQQGSLEEILEAPK